MPSFAPSLSLQSELVEVVMVMLPYTSDNVLAGQSIIFWESVTGSHVRKHILRSGVEPPLFQLQVGTNIVGQSFPVPASPTTTPSGNRRLRLLQDQPAPSQDDLSLIVQFDVAVSFRSESQEQDVRALIYSAWGTPDDRNEYVRALQAESNVFREVMDVLVQVEGFRPPIDNGDDNDGSESSASIGIAVIAGASVGGAALIFLIGFFVMRRRNGSKDDPRQQESKTTPETGSRIAVST
jgi:hypothetical protein